MFSRRSFLASSLFLTTALVVGGATTALLPNRALADDLPYFSPTKIESFDGVSWAGLTLDKTTQDGVKKQFRNGRGDFSTSVLLEQQNSKDVPFRVSALYINKDKNATLDGICIKYKNDSDGIPLTKLQAALGGSGEVRYSNQRFEDYQMIAFPAKGVILFVLQDRVPMILMGHPDRVKNTLSAYQNTNAPDILRYEDQFRDRERLLRFSDTDITYSLKNIKLGDQSREEREVRRDLRASTAGGMILYDPAATDGSYKISVNVNYSNDKGSDGTVEADIQGKGPFGPLSASHTETFKLEKNLGDRRLEDTHYYRALRDAMKAAESDMATKVRTQQPPPVESVRWGDWGGVVDKYRFHSKASTAGTNSLVD